MNLNKKQILEYLSELIAFHKMLNSKSEYNEVLRYAYSWIDKLPNHTHDICLTCKGTGRIEKPSIYYTGGGYTNEAVKRYTLVYKKVWDLLKQEITSDDTIYDLGCGPGIFSELVFRKKHFNYLGLDFSRKMLEKAKARIPYANYSETFNFKLQDLKDESLTNVVKNGKFFVLIEVLEHIIEDEQLLLKLPVNSKIIFTLPSFDATAHVRKFENKQSIKERYQSIVNFENIIQLNNIFICKTRKKKIK